MYISSYRKTISPALLFSATILFTISFLTTSSASYLTAQGSKLYNENGVAVQLTGVNWFGFETTNMFPHGLWARDYHGVLLQIREMGFNCVRIPFCNEMLRSDAKSDQPNFYGEDPWYPREKTQFNAELAGLSPLEMLDEIIRYAGDIGLAVILDNHSREHDGYMNEKRWFTDNITHDQWIADWIMLARRYKNNPAVIGFDLNNEPHGKTVDNGATWGSGSPESDWRSAAEECGNAILKENPDVLIIIEGVEQYEESVYWWGGNLRGVRTHPITLSHPDKLVYSPHEYGPEVFQQPWFFEEEFPDNMEKIWDESFGYIVKENIAPLFIGEFGISNTSSYEGRAGKWFSAFLSYMMDNNYSFTFWALNPNSGDTGGMLSNDWLSVVEWKLDSLKPLLAPQIIGISSPPRPLRRQTMQRLSVGSTTVQAITGSSPHTSIALIDLHGRIIRTTTKSTLSFNHLPHGIYTAVLYMHGTAVERVRIVTR